MILKHSLSLITLMLISACVSGDILTHNYYSNCGNDTDCQKFALINKCTSTANSYPYVRDRLLYDQYGDLFTENATFQIQGRDKQLGRSAIVEALKQRGPLSKTRHVSQLVDIQATSSTQAKGVSYVEIYKLSNDKQNQRLNLWILGEYHDEFIMQDERCLINKRTVKVLGLNQ